MLTALLLGALFCWGNNAEISAKTITPDTMPGNGSAIIPITTEEYIDDKDMLITNGMKLTLQSDENKIECFTPSKYQNITTTKEVETTEKKVVQAKTFKVLYWTAQIGADAERGFSIGNLPNGCTNEQAKELIEILTDTSLNKDTLTTSIKKYNEKNGTNIIWSGPAGDPAWDNTNIRTYNPALVKRLNLQYKDGEWTWDAMRRDTVDSHWAALNNYPTGQSTVTITTKKKVPVTEKVKVGADLTIDQKSYLNIDRANLTTDNNINVTDNSELDVDRTLTLNQGQLLVDKNSVLQASSIKGNGIIRIEDAKRVFVNGDVESKLFHTKGNSQIEINGSITTKGLYNTGKLTLTKEGGQLTISQDKNTSQGSGSINLNSGIINATGSTMNLNTKFINSGTILIKKLSITNEREFHIANGGLIRTGDFEGGSLIIDGDDPTFSNSSKLGRANITNDIKIIKLQNNGILKAQGNIEAQVCPENTGIITGNKNFKICSVISNTNPVTINNGKWLFSEGNIILGETVVLQNNGIIKANVIKVPRQVQTLAEDIYIKGNINLKEKVKYFDEATQDTDLINKEQMTTALNQAKSKLEKPYNEGTGISIDEDQIQLNTNLFRLPTEENKFTLVNYGHISLGSVLLERENALKATITDIKNVKNGKETIHSKDLINGSQLYAVQQSIAEFADRIQTNKNQLEALKFSINAKKAELSGIQKNLSTIKETKLNQDMSNLTTDGEAVIKSQVKKAIQKFQKDMDVSTVQANVQEAKVTTTANTLSSENNEPSIMLTDVSANSDKPGKAAANISKEDITVKADLEQTRKNLQNKADMDTMNVAAYTKQLAKGLTTGESVYHALQEAKEDRLVQAKGNALTIGANGTEAKIDASKKNWTGILVDEKEAGSMANVGYVNQTLSMESSYDRLSLMKKDLEKDTNKGITKAAAMAALKPIGHDEEDKVSFAMGYGHYEDGNAAAIGTFFRPNQDVLIHLDITAGAGKPSMNTGVSFKVGKGSSYASMTREELAAENAAMKDQAEKQAERIHTQKEKIEHLESVMQSIRF